MHEQPSFCRRIDDAATAADCCCGDYHDNDNERHNERIGPARWSLHCCNAAVSCAIIARNALQFLRAIIARFLENVLENIREAKLLQPMTAFGRIT